MRARVVARVAFARASWRARASSPRARVPRGVARAPARRAIVARARAPARRAIRRVVPPRHRLGRARTPRGTRARRFARSATPTPPPRRARVELPLPSIDVGTDDVVYLGLHGQAADWSGRDGAAVSRDAGAARAGRVSTGTRASITGGSTATPRAWDCGACARTTRATKRSR